MESGMRPPPIFTEAGTNADGTINDPAKMGNLTDDQGPSRELNETVTAWRVCHACLNKTPETEAKLLILCPTCAKSIETFLPGGKSE
jgi:hypothetical protein